MQRSDHKAPHRLRLSDPKQCLDRLAPIFMTYPYIQEMAMSEHRLSEIVIERPRHGMRISSTKITGFQKQLTKLTEEATEDGLFGSYVIKTRHKTKFLADHLGPLRRFLRSHVGQPWNDVYSKICQQLDTSTVIGQHVLSHLWDYVELHVELIEGVPYRKDSRGPFICLEPTRYRNQYYVHPETGLLCASNTLRRKSKRSPTQEDILNRDILILNDEKEYRKLNGIWYLIGFQEFPPLPTQYVRDVLRGRISRNQARWDKEGRKLYAASKRQCNKKEIRFIMNQLAKS